jgi:hypothetical protein
MPRSRRRRDGARARKRCASFSNASKPEATRKGSRESRSGRTGTSRGRSPGRCSRTSTPWAAPGT